MAGVPDGNPGLAVSAISPSFVEQLADDRVDAPPVVAVVTCLLLIRTRRPPPPELLQRLHDLHPTQSDLAVILAQALLATGDGTGAAEALLGVAAGMLPCTGEALSDAVRLAHQLARVQDLDPRFREDISALKERLDRALAWFRPGDLFMVFSGPTGVVTPDLVLGYWISRSARTSPRRCNLTFDHSGRERSAVNDAVKIYLHAAIPGLPSRMP